MDVKDFGLWCLLACLWGSSFLAVDIGIETISPLFLVAGRMAVGALFLVAFVYARGGALRLGVRGWLIAAIVGITGNVLPFLLIGFAEQRVDSGLAALIMGIAPVLTLTIAPLVHPDETLGPVKALGAAIGFCGIAVLVGPAAFDGLSGPLIPQVALIGAAMCYASTALFSRRFPHPDPIQMAAGSVLVGAGVICGIAGLNLAGNASAAPSAGSLLAIVYLGLGPTALAALIYFRLISRIGAGRLQQVNYIVPVLGVLLGTIFLGETPGWNAAAAVPMIVTAVYLVSHKVSGRANRAGAPG
ncbi:DMT family transporter [Pelagibacterium halotolerans]|uniref:DMT family transporter n=1 Tax=Pelagibacterium halotolerans TaxID=531813 RepID=UPI00384B0A2A